MTTQAGFGSPNLVPANPPVGWGLLGVGAVLTVVIAALDRSENGLRFTLFVLSIVFALVGGALTAPDRGQDSVALGDGVDRPVVGGWWPALVLFGWVGGLIGYLALKADQPRRAGHVAKWGLIWTGINVFVSLLFFVLLAAAVS